MGITPFPNMEGINIWSHQAVLASRTAWRSWCTWCRWMGWDASVSEIFHFHQLFSWIFFVVNNLDISTYFHLDMLARGFCSTAGPWGLMDLGHKELVSATEISLTLAGLTMAPWTGPGVAHGRLEEDHSWQFAYGSGQVFVVCFFLFFSFFFGGGDEIIGSWTPYFDFLGIKSPAWPLNLIVFSKWFFKVFHLNHLQWCEWPNHQPVDHGL